MRALVPLGILIGICTGCAIPRFDHIRTVQQTIETEPLNSIELTTFNGGITVEPHDKPTIDMEIIYKGYGASEEEARFSSEQLDFTVEADNGNLKIRATKPDNTWMASAAFKIKVPADCALKLNTSNGRVSVADMLANVDVHTSNGTISIKNVSNSVKAKTSNGTINLEYCQGPIDLTTSNGRVVFTGALVGNDNSIHTSNGTVTIKLPELASTEISSRTSNGKIKCSLPEQRVIDEGKRHFHAVVGASGGEQSKLSIKTSNGSIHIDALETPLEQPTTEAEVDEGEYLTL